MSWCRFSTVCDNNKSSDLYIYESDEGLVIHIARGRILNEENAPRLTMFNPCEECTQEQEDELWSGYTQSFLDRRKWLEDNKEWVAIDLPHAGESYCDLSKEDAINLLYKLKELGYNFPSYLFDMTKEWEPNDA